MSDKLAVMATGRPKKKPTRPVRVPAELEKKIKHAAAALDMSGPDYVDMRLTPIVEKDLDSIAKGILKKKDTPATPGKKTD